MSEYAKAVARVIAAAQKVASGPGYHPTHLGDCIGVLSTPDCKCGVSDLLFAVRALEEATGNDWHAEYRPPFSNEADRLSWSIASQRLGWIQDDDGRVVLPFTAHDDHISDGGCAICRAGDAPIALRVVIDAVIDAHIARHIGTTVNPSGRTAHGHG